MESKVEFKSMKRHEKMRSRSTLNMLVMLGCLAGSTLVYADDNQSSTDTTSTPKSGGMFNSIGSGIGSGLDSTIDWFGFNHTRVDGLHSLYVGVGDTNSLLHAYVEAPTRFGHVYAKVGEFFAGNKVVGQVGFRMPYQYNSNQNNNGVYFGAYAGYLDNTSIGDSSTRKDRLGAALEMSYLFLNKASLTAASVSIGGAQRLSAGNADQQKITPMIMFGLDFGLGIY
ncbi:MAG: hypothetical protein KGO49_13540 [Gammaproteobacteria bacterium]|nr:hypothetical protein [Gammaproteobacteria bacterium]